ncbi:MAG: hypothetical protein GT600_17415, partial [Bacteroidales bacterium]|nr:hypothetical protein [Bacteroidales bacterium]
WCMVHGAWCMVHGAWCMVHGAWCMVQKKRKNYIISYFITRNIINYLEETIKNAKDKLLRSGS